LNKIENDLALVKHQSTNNENLEKRKEESDKHTKEADVSTKVDTWNMMCFADILPYFMSCVAP
jgi:hypothetical protein